MYFETFVMWVFCFVLFNSFFPLFMGGQAWYTQWYTGLLLAVFKGHYVVLRIKQHARHVSYSLYYLYGPDLVISFTHIVIGNYSYSLLSQ